MESPEHPDRTVDVLVVGAGLAGLKAALELTAAGRSVRVLEARDRVGGRSKAGEICGQTIDLGGQWVGPDQKLLLAQAKELGVETRPQYVEGKSRLSMDGRLTESDSEIPRLPFLSLLEIAALERRWKRETKTLPDGAPWAADQAGAWDAHSIESWMRRHVRLHTTREFLRVVTRALLCAEADQVSYLCFLEYLRQGHGLDKLIGVEGGAQQDKFVGGAWQIPQRMAERLGDAVLLEHPVQSIEQHDGPNGGGVHVETPRGRFSAERVIVAVPPGLAAQIHFTRALPSRRRGLLQRMPMGAVIKVHVAYETPFWRRRGWSGAAAANDRHLNVVFDQTPEDESLGLLVGFFDGARAVEMSAAGVEARQAQAVDDLVTYFGDDAATPIGYVDQDWTQERWSLGGYVAHMPPGVMTTYGPAIREPCGRVHWAGTETATEWCGYFDGALQSGVRAAREVLEAMK